MSTDNKMVEVFESKGIKFYQPANGEYHLSRYVAAGAQNIFSACGITKTLLQTFMDKMIEMCNDEKSLKTLRTDIAIMCNNLLYRTKYPVDEDCAIRMGAIYCILEGEDPDICDASLTEKKVQMTRQDPDLYTFFLTMGIKYTPAWSESGTDMSDMEYFSKRMETLNALIPQ